MAVAIFVIVLAVLVFVHELGHFIVARRAGARVDEFGIGFPPRLFAWKRGETTYSINLIPLGGFVKIFGEDEAEIKKPGAFGALPISKRAKVLVAGVLMNAILAWVLFSITAAAGQPTLVDESNDAQATDIKVRILKVKENSPAAEAGFKAGDAVVGYTSVGDLQGFIKSNQGREVTIPIERGGEILEVKVTPRAEFVEGEGALGVFLGKTGIIKVPFWQAPWEGLKTTGLLIAAIFLFVIDLVASVATGGGGEIVQNLAGPVGIAALTGEAARLGIVNLLQFTAILSVNLAILNILPFPALDGGRLVFLGIEKLNGKPVNKEIEHATNMVGFMLLILLMIFVTWQDIARFVL